MESERTEAAHKLEDIVLIGLDLSSEPINMGTISSRARPYRRVFAF